MTGRWPGNGQSPVGLDVEQAVSSQLFPVPFVPLPVDASTTSVVVFFVAAFSKKLFDADPATT